MRREGVLEAIGVVSPLIRVSSGLRERSGSCRTRTRSLPALRAYVSGSNSDKQEVITNHVSPSPRLLLILQLLPRRPGLRVIAGMSQIAHFRANHRPFLFFQAGPINIHAVIHYGGLNEN